MIIDDNYMVCSDCAPVIANGDYTHLDFYYSEDDESGDPTASEMVERIDAGMDAAKGTIIMSFDDDKNDGFSLDPCDCCGARGHGERTHCIVMKN